MKNNLKKKVMLAVLAGGMLCANGAFAADTVAKWYGTTGNPGDTYGKWTTSSGSAKPSHLKLSITYLTKNIEDFKVTVENVTGQIYGGYTETNGVEVTDNSITFNTPKTTTINALIYGAYSSSNGDATNNLVTIINGTFNDSICGGYSSSGSAGGDTLEKGNKVIIEGGTFNNNCVCGGDSWSGTAKNNSVTIEKGTFNDVIIYGGYSESGNAINNSITIGSGTFNSSTDIYGGYSSSGSAKNNSVIINNGTFSHWVVGGDSSSNGSGDATSNSVTINNGTFNASIYGGYSSKGNAKNNSVTINGGTFEASSYITGGYVVNASKTCVKNVVTINGGTFNNMGGFSGGQVGRSKPYGDGTNNTLNLKIKMGGKQGCADFFQTYNFTLPVGTTDRDVMMSVKKLAVDYQGGTATVNVYAANGVNLTKDDVITLIQYDSKSDTFKGGDVLGGAGTVTVDDNKLVLTMLQDFEGPYLQKEGSDADQQKAPAEGVAAAAAMVNVSADLASGEGMDSMLVETAGGETNTFGAISAGRSKFKTGSHVDVDGWGVVVGAGKTKEWTNGSATTMGIFLEYGKGDFDTYNGAFHGDGDTKNHGVGVMARHKMTNNSYYEGNIRYGRQETSWGQSEIGGYETDSRYYGVMAGMGHIFQVGKNELDVYGRYSYGHVGACNAKVGDNDYRFDSVKSHRVRVGGKYNFVQENSKAKPFVGVAWEHEFNGESKATIAGVGQAPAPGLKGNTGIIQAGCDWDLGEKWSAGASANAYMGKRKGWDGMLRAFYSF